MNRREAGGRRRGVRWGAALGVALVLIAAGGAAMAVLLPSWIRDRCIEEAAREGVVLGIEAASVGIGAVHLQGVHATLRDAPQLRISAPEADVGLDLLTPRTVSLRDATVTLDGPLRATGEALARATASRAGTPGGTPAASSALEALTVTGVLVWKRPVGDATEARVTGLYFTLLPATHTWTATGAPLTVVGVASGLGPWAFDARGDATSSHVRISLDASKPAAPPSIALARAGAAQTLDLAIPPAVPSRLGIPAALLGLASDASAVEAALHATIGDERIDGTGRIGVHGVRLQGIPIATDVSLEGTLAGDPRAPMQLTRGTLTLGPVRAAVDGTITAALGALRGDLAFRAGPSPCPLLPGTMALEGRIRFDSSRPSATSATIDRASMCGLW